MATPFTEAQRRTLDGILSTPVQQMCQKLSALPAEQYRAVRKKSFDWLDDKTTCARLGIRGYPTNEDCCRADYVAMKVVVENMDLRPYLF